MPPGLLDDDAFKAGADSAAPGFDYFDPQLDDFSAAFRRATSDDPLMSGIKPTVLGRLERRLGKPANEWTPDEQRVALRTLGFLVDRAYTWAAAGLRLRSEAEAPPAARAVGRPRKWRGPDLATLTPKEIFDWLFRTPLQPRTGLLGTFKRGGRPRKSHTSTDDALIALVEAEKSRPGESDRAALKRIVGAELKARGRGEYRLEGEVNRRAAALSRARRRRNTETGQ